jgi:hypothetical protein
LKETNMTTFSKTNRAMSLQHIAALCVLMAAASAHAGYGGIKEPPAGPNGWTPAVTTNAKVANISSATVRALPKSGLTTSNGWTNGWNSSNSWSNGLDGMNSWSNGLDGMNGHNGTNGHVGTNSWSNGLTNQPATLPTLQQLARAPLAQ